MMIFYPNEEEKLIEFLYKAVYIHDSKIVSITNISNSILMFFNNLFYKKEFVIVFENVKNIHCSIEENFDDNQYVSYLGINKEKCTNTEFCFEIERFSGSLVEIFCKQVAIIL